ncbi:MAG: hypothetical protein M3R62_10705 [Acidobacteriota bacterium]|nr:hypothetical protein [Acidobacteriota bacterium]
MTAGLLWLASLLALPAAGAPLLLDPVFRKYGAPARFVLAGAVGGVALSETMTLASLFRLPWNLAGLVLAAAILCFALRFALPRKGAPTEAPAPTPLSTFERAGFAVCAAAVVAAAASALSSAATSPDLILFWGPKAEVFAAALGIDDNFLGEPFLRYLHTSYPPLVTNIYAFATMAAGRFSWMGAVATFPLLLSAAVAALPGVLRLAVPRREAIAGAAAIAASLAFLGHRLEIAGNADMALLVYAALATAVLLGPAGEERSGQLLAGLLLGGAAASKVEGLPLVVAAGGLFLLQRRRAVSWRWTPVLLFAPTVLSLGAWFLFGRLRYLFRGYEGYGRARDVRFDQIPSVLAELATALWRAGALPWLLPIAALAAAKGKSPRFLYPTGVAAVLSAFFLFTYLHDVPDRQLWIAWSAGRVFAVVSVLLVLAVIAGRTKPGDGGTAGGPGTEEATRG